MGGLTSVVVVYLFCNLLIIHTLLIGAVGEKNRSTIEFAEPEWFDSLSYTNDLLLY